jgi:hypothetical protein
VWRSQENNDELEVHQRQVEAAEGEGMWKIAGWFRTLFLACPECNSSAPECHTCEVCDDVRYLSRKLIKEVIWPRFLAKHKENTT